MEPTFCALCPSSYQCPYWLRVLWLVVFLGFPLLIRLVLSARYRPLVALQAVPVHLPLAGWLVRCPLWAVWAVLPWVIGCISNIYCLAVRRPFESLSPILLFWLEQTEACLWSHFPAYWLASVSSPTTPSVCTKSALLHTVPPPLLPPPKYFVLRMMLTYLLTSDGVLCALPVVPSSMTGSCVLKTRVLCKGILRTSILPLCWTRVRGSLTVILILPSLGLRSGFRRLVKAIISSLELSNATWFLSSDCTVLIRALFSPWHSRSIECATTSHLQSSANDVTVHYSTSFSTSLNTPLRSIANRIDVTGDPYDTPVSSPNYEHWWLSITNPTLLSDMNDSVHLIRLPLAPMLSMVRSKQFCLRGQMLPWRPLAVYLPASPLLKPLASCWWSFPRRLWRFTFSLSQSGPSRAHGLSRTIPQEDLLPPSLPSFRDSWVG